MKDNKYKDGLGKKTASEWREIFGKNYMSHNENRDSYQWSTTTNRALEEEMLSEVYYFDTPPPSLSDQQFMFLQDQAQLILYISSLEGIKATGGELYRTKDQQSIYLRKGLSWTSHSMHLERLAIDLNIFYNNHLIRDKKHRVLKDLAIFWESLDNCNRAGYRFGDSGHFERRHHDDDWSQNEEGRSIMI